MVVLHSKGGFFLEILKVVDLKKHYGDVKAVDGISFTVERGTVFSFLGPNGAGKTTTVEILEGLRKKDSGEIYYFGERKDVLDRETKRKIGVCLQKSAFFENLTVWETLKLFRGLYGTGLDLKEVMGLFSLENIEKKMVKTLSGGQLQRLAVAVAFINDPEIVFLDEPTTGLDPQARRQIWDTIEHFKNLGKTIFLTTHYMEEAERLSDHVCIIDHGKIIAEGTPSSLISSSGLKTVVEFDCDQDVNVRYLEKKENHYVVETDAPEELIKDLLKNWNVSNIVIRKPNLEDVFLKLTGRDLRE
ncbi:ABC transporter ATP-binding protein [Thermotoga maritima MSB8]|uniref:ABC transporter, ATP-binding protein n=1 Tax=Thermotoga maritima (strain ATCC 43589 / DSM 3109 / JCM 10099 / NBRC 100826 / MSB8) TaxID=243274 RepID=Q9WYM0_THEMA|nr:MULTISPECIES: ABC transporter ATP-binding protein [Thermotoga]AAD35474.1 ABC transporter, ATP-binding protein [Thermotoga maritima MSB8]AKE26322.1 ABC transporter ATP-binding protein [Thermotoga maritima]AKE29642.1 ABC transporter ATP-binding protein [Thermotoga maritima MSB8]AKE30060.1 ABC transporter ATP-binding protein [Thermotoga maritima]